MELVKTIKFNASSEAEGMKKLSSLVSLLNTVAVDDLQYLADISKRKPGWVKKAKPYERFL